MEVSLLYMFLKLKVVTHAAVVAINFCVNHIVYKFCCLLQVVVSVHM